MEISITPAQMRALEEQYMKETGMPGALLMEHAAQGIIAAISRSTKGQRALFLCGPGNNGGDGYAAARLWAACGNESTVLELTDAVRGDAALNRLLALQSGVTLLAADGVSVLPACDVIVDALFGTGLSRAADGTAARLIRLVNASGVPVIAVDIPSGLDGTTGLPLGPAIRAAETVTFHRPKQGLLMTPAAPFVGRLTVQPILIPAGYGQQEGLRCLRPEDLPAVIPPRPIDAHKGTFGRVVIIAGSPGMAGAAAFAARAAIRTGAGLTTLVCRASILPILQVLVPGATCTVLPEADGRLLPEAKEIAAGALAGASAAVVGCGIGQTDDWLPVLCAAKVAACPVIWDADALNLLAAHPALLPLKAADTVTPHPGEAARLLGCSTVDVTRDPLAAIDALYRRTGCHVLLKGARTLMTDGDHTAVNRFGTPAMAKGGSGDILSGILAALTARLSPSLLALQAAALLHAQAALRAEEASGEDGLEPEAFIRGIRISR